VASVGFYGIFGIDVDLSKSVKGSCFLRKKPLEGVLSVYSNSENAIGVAAIAERCRDEQQKGPARGRPLG
jgi:hypothetical protein